MKLELVTCGGGQGAAPGQEYPPTGSAGMVEVTKSRMATFGKVVFMRYVKSVTETTEPAENEKGHWAHESFTAGPIAPMVPFSYSKFRSIPVIDSTCGVETDDDW